MRAASMRPPCWRWPCNSISRNHLHPAFDCGRCAGAHLHHGLRDALCRASHAGQRAGRARAPGWRRCTAPGIQGRGSAGTSRGRRLDLHRTLPRRPAHGAIAPVAWRGGRPAGPGRKRPGRRSHVGRYRCRPVPHCAALARGSAPCPARQRPAGPLAGQQPGAQDGLCVRL
jgi:hypothetical protein